MLEVEDQVKVDEVWLAWKAAGRQGQKAVPGSIRCRVRYH
jgi:hypothetical protein